MTDKKTDAEPAKNPAPGPQSTKPVAASAVAVKDTDEAPKNSVSDNSTSKPAETVKDGVAKKVEVTEPNNDIDDKDIGKELTPEEEAELEAHLGDEAEPTISAEARAKGEDSAKKFVKLLKVVPTDTPDEHVIWGAGGVVITLGDIRNIFGHVPVK